MFEHLVRHDKILVTGTHRSGTTFAASAIHHDLRDTHGLVREELVWHEALSTKYFDMWVRELDAKLVIQAPFLADICHQYPECMVVFMHRRLEEIDRSQREHMFTPDGRPVDWWRMNRQEMAKYNSDEHISSNVIKYENWLEQRERLPHYLELRYDDLKAHPLWVDRRTRQSFHVRQTRVA